MIKLGNISKELPVFAADMGEDCLLGADFLAAVNLENIFKPIFGNPDLGQEEDFVFADTEFWGCFSILERTFWKRNEGFKWEPERSFCLIFNW